MHSPIILRSVVCATLAGFLAPPATALDLSPTEAGRFADLDGKQLQRFNNIDVADFLTLRYKRLGSLEPRSIIQPLAKKAVGQPYRLSASRFDWSEVDCVVFVERTLALSLSKDWAAFHLLSQRLRHKKGIVEYTNRNFFTLQEWLPNNAWLLSDITGELRSNGRTVAQTFTYVARPKRFLPAREGEPVPVFAGADYSSANKEEHTQLFIPRERVPDILPQLESGDVCLVLREFRQEGLKPWLDCDHMGLIMREVNGNAVLLHAAPPEVRQDDVRGFLRMYHAVAGFVFLRLRPDAAQVAEAEVARMATKVSVPTPDEQERRNQELRARRR